jgi:hypothetical protein
VSVPYQRVFIGAQVMTQIDSPRNFRRQLRSLQPDLTGVHVSRPGLRGSEVTPRVKSLQNLRLGGWG